ncbi:MAG: HD domain-containing protein [Armatimonadota bacterium]
MHPALETIRSCVVGTPFEGDLYLVGGAVRDSLLGLDGSDDLDLVSTQPASALVELLWNRGVCDFHPVVYERFGTAMVSVGGQKVEVVQTRRESYSARSRKPSVQPGTLREDAERRDFTINSLMRSLNDWSLVDPLGCGVDDLQNGVLRTPLEPRKTFHDDPLRMLRAVRFRHRFGFSYFEGLAEAISISAPRLKIISTERIRDEVFKMLLHPSASAALDDLLSLGLLEQFLPEFLPLKGCEQGEWHYQDAWDHTRQVVDNLHNLSRRIGKIQVESVESGEDHDLEPVAHLTPQPPLPPGAEMGSPGIATLLAGLFHDVAKPQTRTEPVPGEVHFYGHDHEGAKVARRVLKRLKVPGDTIDVVSILVENHMRLSSANEFGTPAIRRLIRDMGEQLDPLLDLCEADRLAHKNGAPLTDLRQRIDKVRKETPAESLESPLSGEEIMELLSLPPGPEVGVWKKRLVEALIEGTIEDPDSARAWLLNGIAVGVTSTSSATDSPQQS